MPVPTSNFIAANSRGTTTPQTSKRKPLPAAAVEATAEAFVAGFNALPGAVRWRIVQLIEEQEDAADAREMAAIQAGRPADGPSADAVPFEQVMAEYESKHGVKLT